MNNFCNLIFLLLLWKAFSTHAESHYYRRSYYTPIATPPTRYHSSSNSGFVPMTYSGDLFSAESKRKDSSSKSYSKKIPYRTIDSDEDNSNERYTSDEYSNEAHGYTSKEHDSREFTIGTQIRVQHPITVPKKSTSSYPKHTKYTSHVPAPSSYKPSSYSDLNLSAESPDPPPPKKHHSPSKYTQLYEPDPFHLVPPPKSTAATKGAASYDVYEPDQEDYEPLPPSSSRTKSLLRDRFKSVASKKQIEKYLEDQQKMLDEAVKMQLLNDPKFEQYLKAKEKERIESEQFELDSPVSSNGPPPYRSNFNDNLPPFKANLPRRRPQTAELKRPPKNKHSKRRFRSALVFNV